MYIIRSIPLMQRNRKLQLVLLTIFMSLTNLKAQTYTIVEGNNKFAFDLYRECGRGHTENVFISPFSISCAMAMTYPGARGKTAEEMKTAMRFLSDLKTQNNEYSYLLRELAEADSALIINNTVWTHNGMIYEPEFMDIMTSYFGSNFKQVNFADSEKTREEINKAIEVQTQEKIKDLIPEKSITPDTRLVLTNAVYFKDTWAVPFKKELTHKGKFYTASKTINAMFMQGSGSFNGFENDAVSILELPYKDRRFSMLILLPKRTIEEFEKSVLTADNYASWHLSRVVFDKILLPRFKMEQTTNVIPILEGFGMTTAFKEDEADFSGITTEQSLSISGIYHKAFVEVNEDGTEAAASTSVVITQRTGRPKQSNFIADHPFIFIIQDVKSKSILFIGKLTNP